MSTDIEKMIGEDDRAQSWAQVAVTRSPNIWDVFLPPNWDFQQGRACCNHLINLMEKDDAWELRAHCAAVRSYSVQLGPMWVKAFSTYRASISSIVVVDAPPVLSFVVVSTRLALRQVPLSPARTVSLSNIPPQSQRIYPPISK